MSILSAWAGGPELARATSLYQHTQYEAALRLLLPAPEKDAPTWCLIGQNYFMSGEYKKASDAFEKAIEAAPNRGEYYHWLGRAYGRRAETGSPFTAPAYAVKARGNFEKGVELDPNNLEIINDLFDYYLQAPGFLGGGADKAVTIAKRIARLDPVEGHWAQAQIAKQKKDYQTAEQQLRRALEMSSAKLGRILDLAKFLGSRGRQQESDELFAQAEKLSPNTPKVWYARAASLIKQKRDLDTAKSLLERYLRASLTPDDESRAEAQRLLREAVGG